MATERRLTMHNGRSHKGGKTFSAKHNDHTQKNGNWDIEKRGEDWFWKSKQCPGKNFDEGERAFYEKYFRTTLDEQNERHRASRHLERIKTMDDFRTSKNYCPEETLFYLGDKNHEADREVFKHIMIEYSKWHQDTFPLCKILNMAEHGDEDGARHWHQRKCWMAKDEKGNWIVSQNKSLEQMGVELPEPGEKTSGKNNRKVTYTKMCREKLFELAKQYGVELETEPRSKEESGMSRSEFIEKKTTEKEKEVQEKIAQLKELNETDIAEFEDRKALIGELRQDLIKSANKEFEGDLGGKLKATSIIRECIHRALEKLGIIKKRVDERTEQIQKIEPTYKMTLKMPEEEELER